MRILVAMDAFGPWTSLDLGRLVGAGWAGQQVDVVPVGESGAGFVTAYADLIGARPEPVDLGPRGTAAVAVADAEVVGGLWSVQGARPQPSSGGLGDVLAHAVRHRPDRVVLDLHWTTDPLAADGGAGLLAGLGASADVDLAEGAPALRQLTRLDPAAARAALEGIDLIGVVPAGEEAAVLGGLRGITSRHARSSGADTAELLATDAALVGLARQLGVDPQAPGSGACGGVGTAVLGLGGRLDTGPAVALTGSAAAVRGPYDLVVTGGARYDFASRGGGVVAELAAAARRWLCPCIVIAGEVQIGGREMRTMGVESAYATGPSTDLPAVVARIARSWTF